MFSLIKALRKTEWLIKKKYDAIIISVYKAILYFLSVVMSEGGWIRLVCIVAVAGPAALLSLRRVSIRQLLSWLARIELLLINKDLLLTLRADCLLGEQWGGRSIVLNTVVGPQRLLIARAPRDDIYCVDRGVGVRILEAYEILLALGLWVLHRTASHVLLINFVTFFRQGAAARLFDETARPSIIICCSDRLLFQVWILLLVINFDIIKTLFDVQQTERGRRLGNAGFLRQRVRGHGWSFLLR